MTDQLLTLTQAAAALEISASTLRHQVHNGVLPATLIGKTWVVTRADVERYRRDHLGKVGRPEGAKDSRPRKRST
jgi:excisionase family DNA binding protein